jgi:hypothetical protein
LRAVGCSQGRTVGQRPELLAAQVGGRRVDHHDAHQRHDDEEPTIITVT